MHTPDYAADLSIPILDCGRNAKRKGDQLLDHVHCTMYMCRPNYIILLYYNILT